MNIVAEHFWDFLQKNPNYTRQIDPIQPLSDQCIMLNTMADLCIGGELLCESMEPDMGLCFDESAGGSNRNRGARGRRSGMKGGKGSRMGGKAGRAGMMRSGMMRSTMMRQGMMGGGLGNGMNSHFFQSGRKLEKIHEDCHGDDLYEHDVSSIQLEQKPSTIECFAEIVSKKLFVSNLYITQNILIYDVVSILQLYFSGLIFVAGVCFQGNYILRSYHFLFN